MDKKFKELEIKLQQDIVLKILALIMAIIIFITITGVGTPFWNDMFTSTQYVDNVPLEVHYDDDKLAIKGLPKTIDVNITGAANEVSAAAKQSKNLIGSLDIKYTNPKEYTVDTRNIKFNSSSAVKIIPVMSTFNIEIQERITQTRSIDVNYINGEKTDSGVVLEEPELSSQSVKVIGGNKDVNDTVSIRGFIDLEKLKFDSSQGEQEFKVKLVPYNSDGYVMSNVDIEPSVIDVKQKFRLAGIEVPVNYKVINNNTGMYVSSICDVELQGSCVDGYVPTITLYGNAQKIDAIENVTYQIDLANFKGNKSEVSGTPILESGVYVLGNRDKKYDVTLEKGSTKTIKKVPVTVIGLDKRFSAKALNQSETNVNVRVTGAKSVIDNLSAPDIDLSLDLSDIKKKGTITVPIILTSAKYFDHTLSRDEISIEVFEVKDE